MEFYHITSVVLHVVYGFPVFPCHWFLLLLALFSFGVCESVCLSASVCTCVCARGMHFKPLKFYSRNGQEIAPEINLAADLRLKAIKSLIVSQ